MKAQFVLGSLLGISAVACGGDPGAEPATPPASAAADVDVPPGFSANAVRAGVLPVSGRLDGQVHGVDLATETTANDGSFEVWAAGGGQASLNIAAAGTSSGAGMLMLRFVGTAFDDLLQTGAWSSSDPAAHDATAVTSVVSCAGPSVGDWPYELPAVSAEMSASDDPERPNGVVVVVKGQFDAAHLGANATSELIGTFRFDRFE